MCKVPQLMLEVHRSHFVLSCADLVCHSVDDVLGVGGDLGLGREALAGDVDGDLA